MTSGTQPAGSGPTALRVQLGARLRRLRKHRQVTRERAGWEIRASESKISRMELGRVPFKERDVADLLTLYGVGADERDEMLSLAREANAPGWWHEFGDVVPPWFLSYLGLEEAASLIRVYELHFVPGLLQTAGYARAVVESGHTGAPTDEIERRIALRRGRQHLLRRPNAPHVWAVLDEGVLYRHFGGPDVMRAQIEALIEMTELPHVRIQIVPLRDSVRAAAGMPFAILRFPDVELSDVVYVEHLTSALYLDKPSDVDQYARMMELACVVAEPPEDTAAILGKVLDDLCGPQI
jgi:hypothetical protein